LIRPDQVIVKPIITEKAIGVRPLARYVFRVRLHVTKDAVRQAVERIFKVKVVKVNTTRVRPKRRIQGRFIGRTSSWKKAYVTLAKGQKIEELEA
jgi:large subunit ribosomal protein L23